MTATIGTVDGNRGTLAATIVTAQEGTAVSKKGRKKRNRAKNSANHGKRPNT